MYMAMEGRTPTLTELVESGYVRASDLSAWNLSPAQFHIDAEGKVTLRASPPTTQTHPGQ